MSEAVAYWDRNPCGLARVRRGVNRYRYQPHIIPFMELDRWAGKHVLEIGCGLGEDGRQFIDAGATYYGVDQSEASVSLALDQWEKDEPERSRLFLPFYVGNGSFLALGQGMFDLVYSFGVVHHDDNPVMLVGSMFDYLKPGGALKLMVYHSRSRKAAGLRARHGMKWRRHTEPVPGVPISRTYTKRQARKLVERAVFTDVRMQTAMGGWHLLIDAVKP